MNGFARNRVLHEDFSKFDGILHFCYEDDDLIELELVNQVHQLGNFLTLVKLDIVLAKTMECQFAFVFNEHFGWVAHELAARDLNIVRKRGCKHHDLLIDGRVLEYLLDV